MISAIYDRWSMRLLLVIRTNFLKKDHERKWMI